MKKAVLNWSGGKDSSLTLYHLKKSKEFDIQCLLTSVNSSYQRISMHGVRLELLEEQAKQIALPLETLMLPETQTMESYDQTIAKKLKSLKEHGVEYSIFGDIFLEDLRQYREDRLKEVDLKGIFPIWKRPTQELVREFIDQGFKAILVCVNEKYLDQSFAGREINDSLLKDLPDNVDPCGENGEFHSFVYDGPLFSQPINFKIGETIYKKYEPPQNSTTPNNTSDCYDTGFWYCDLIPN